MSDPNSNASHFYGLMLESCERLVHNELEQPAFEEQVGLCFESITLEAHKIFSIDEVMCLIIKQVQVILANFKSQKLPETLKRDRDIPSLATQDYLNSRLTNGTWAGREYPMFIGC
ncbi:hypothetical protein ARMSODRAFT_540892 [Armillaria solidipes]|uniref:Sin3 C-terminal domain-containing protein n=1 Tax=Armillaria solidipes TaxID=1076256 RepID=A0A2H3BFK7_9AGAR|nr:hypothetical protein ARMSODRAFT_540892 [Armillaria solidipes]